jgi:polysaccharide deacetylase 2 family uncharacterized protein YibQ
VARKSRKAPRRGKRSIPWLWVVAGVVIVAAAFAVARHHGTRPFGRVLAPSTASRADVAEPALKGVDAPGADEPFLPIAVKSDWDRMRLRTESEFLRLVRGSDRAALHRLTSRTLRGALEEAGVTRAMIDERPGTAAAAGVAPAPVQWKIQVPPRASLFKINDAVSQAMEVLGGQVISGRERPGREIGTALDLRVGYGDRVTHAIVVEPSPELADTGAEIAFVVTDLDPASETLFRSFLSSPIPFTIALRPDVPHAKRAARAMRDAGRELFLNLPMEPRGYPRIDPGKDAILLDLSRVEIEERISRSLGTLGEPRGIVTRMGSAAVNDPDVMRAVLGEVKRRDLLFIDAHGAGPSVVEDTGEEIGARTLTLGATLDATGSPAAIRARLAQLVATAQQRGALAVGVRANALVLTVLEAERAKLEKDGVAIVPASKLVL